MTFLGGLLMGCGQICGQSVSRLEAIHVAEIHTGQVVAGVRYREGSRDGYYDLALKSGGQARVDAKQGRLIFVRRVGEGADYQWPGIRVVAHRGGVALGPPENTIPAIQRAIEVGADLIEIDIRETADGRLVLMHDRTVNRTTNGVGEVRRLTWDAIRSLNVEHGGDERIGVPLLSEALEVMKGQIDADLDFKEGDLEKLIAAVRAAGMEDHATMHSSWERCQEVSAIEPRIRIRPTVAHPGQVRDLIRELRPAMVNFDWQAVTEQAVRETHLGGCLAFVNCLGSADTDFYVNEAIRIGADYIQSDRPDRVIEILRELGLRSDRPILGSGLGTPLRHPRLRYPLR